jgi:hypothetical protein
MTTTSFARLAWFLMAIIFASMTCHAQSTAETAEGIKRELDGIKTEFVSTLQSAASNPENLQSGQTKANCEQILSKLEGLQSRLNSTADLLAKRETDLNGKAGLSEADKLELKQTLQAQRKPIEACKQTAAQLQTELKSFNASKIPVIQEIYKNYLDIAGPEQAKAKVQANIQPLLAPYVPPKPKPTPTPKASPSPSLSAPQNAAKATPQQSMPTISPAQLDQSQSELQQAKAVKAQLAKILNETNNTPPPAPQTPKTPKAKKQSIPIWSPTDKLPKEVRGHGLAGNFAIQGSSSDGSIILVPADDANNPFARQFWIVNRSFSGGPNVLVPLGQRRIIQVPNSHPLIIVGRGILPGIYNVEDR